jgi:hypothetical protein
VVISGCAPEESQIGPAEGGCGHREASEARPRAVQASPALGAAQDSRASSSRSTSAPPSQEPSGIAR